MLPARHHRILTPLVIILLVLAAAVCALAQGSGVVETKLPNGLTVLMKESHAAPVFTAQVWFRTGSRNEHTGITGISHLLEHMLFNSSKNFKKGEITRMIREKGGIKNAATWTDFTYYWQLLSSEHLELSLKTLAERAGNALLLDSEFQKERTVVLSERQGHETEPGWLMYHGLMAAAFEAHPYQWPVIGWQSDIENISREQLATYYHTYYHPNNATLVLVGDFDSKKALELVKKHFAAKPAAKLPRPMYTTEPKQRGKRTVNVRLQGNAERVELGYHIPSLTDPDTYPLTVLDQVLSGGRSSRLYQALVEKQIATSAWSSSGGRRDPSLFMLGATARQGVKGDAIEKALIEQVERAKTELPTEQEMQAAKNQLQAYLIFQNDSVSDQGEQLGYYSAVATWQYVETMIPRINAVTPQQVLDVATKYLNEDNLTVARFIPSNGAPAGSGAGPADVQGPIRNSRSPDVCYKTKPSATAVRPPTPNSQLPTPSRTVLPNGLIVIVQENHSNPTVAVAGNLKAGSYFDPEGKAGTASLVAEMIARGTTTRSALEIAKATDYVGASIDTSSGVESAQFGAKSLTKDFPMVIELLADELRNASFPEDQFERAKGETLSGLEQSKESPEARAFRAFYNSVFPAGHPYHDLTFDDAEKSLRAITRDDLIAFHKGYYRPDTTVIVIAGDVKAKDAVDLVKHHFGDWKADGPAPVVDIPTIPPQKQATSITIDMPDKSESSIVFGYALGLKRSDPDYYAVRIMNQVLGGAGALASVLGEEIREKRGLAYDVYSTFDANLGAGAWYAGLGTNPKNVSQALEALKSNIAAFKKTGPTKKQCEQAREFIIGVFPIALETNAGVARALMNAEFYGLGMDYVRDFAGIYRAVTHEQVKAAAAKYLHPDAATLVIAGPNP